MKFKYTALGASNQKLEGVLDTESLDAAREELHKMGMSVVGIEEVSAEEAATLEAQKATPAPGQEGIISYFFVAKDNQGKEVNGTIDSRDPSTAYRRLRTEYRFELLDLYPQNAKDPVAESLKPKFEEWNAALEEEGIDLSRKGSTGAKSDMEDEGEEMSAEVVTEIDHFIINTKKILSDFNTRYSDALLAEIQNTLGELERIRASNNLQHITKICNDLYELVSNPDAAGEAENGALNEDYQKTISTLGGSGFVSNKFKFAQLHNLQKKLARFEKLQKIIARVKKIFNRRKADEIDKHYATKIKTRKARWLSQLTSSLKEEKGSSQPGILTVVSKLFAFISAPSSILRRARKQELIKTFNAWKEGKKQAKTAKAEAKKSASGASAAEGMTTEEAGTVLSEKPKKDFSGFFMELDSFIGWLLFFYISYFFLVSFAIEKNIGLPKEIFLKTLSSPLIVNISIFLVIAHLAFTLKLRLFRANLLGSLFLFFFCFGAYALIIVNF